MMEYPIAKEYRDDFAEKEPEIPSEKRLMHRERARSRLAYLVAGAYLVLLLIAVVVPLTMLWRKDITFTETQVLILIISGALSGLVGLAGFVVGYYFKSEEMRT